MGFCLGMLLGCTYCCSSCELWSSMPSLSWPSSGFRTHHRFEFSNLPQTVHIATVSERATIGTSSGCLCWQTQTHLHFRLLPKAPCHLVGNLQSQCGKNCLALLRSFVVSRPDRVHSPAGLPRCRPHERVDQDWAPAPRTRIC